MFSRSFWEPLAERCSPCCPSWLLRQGYDGRHGTDDGQWFVLGAVRATHLGVARGFASRHKDHRLGLRRSAATLACVGPVWEAEMLYIKELPGAFALGDYKAVIVGAP